MIEEKFQQFRQTVTSEEFNSIEFLKNKADELKHTDLALSKRILMRVENLKKQSSSENQAKVNSRKNAAVTADTKGEIIHFLSQLRTQPFVLFVVIPVAIFGFYQCLIASERFESRAQVIVQQPDGMATMDASMAVLTGLGVSNSGISDVKLVEAYIKSYDMLQYLDKQLELKKHYTSQHIDYFSRLDEQSSKEDFLNFYHEHVTVYIDSNSSVVHLFAQAFEPDFAHKLAQTIVERAEWYINSIGHQLADAQLEFIQGEHQLVEAKLLDAKNKLLSFQQQNNLLDPMAEGVAQQKIAYTLEGEISAKKAELKGLKTIMSPNAPQVLGLETQLLALQEQLQSERQKLSQDSSEFLPVSEILANYSDLKIKMDLALQAYTSSQVSLEKSRIEAYRKLKYLVIVESPTLPQEHQYPDAFYNVALFAVVMSMLFAIGKIILLTIRELK